MLADALILAALVAPLGLAAWAEQRHARGKRPWWLPALWWLAVVTLGLAAALIVVGMVGGIAVALWRTMIG